MNKNLKGKISAAFVTAACLNFLGIGAIQTQAASRTSPDLPLEALVTPPTLEQVIARLETLEKGKVLRQTTTYRSAAPGSIVREQLYVDPAGRSAKLVHETLLGNQIDPGRVLDPANSKVEFVFLVNSTGRYALDIPTGKWSMQFGAPSLSEYKDKINKAFLDSTPPFSELLSVYFQQYQSFQKQGLASEATSILDEIKQIKNPGLQYTNIIPGDPVHKQEYAFYDNGIVHEIRFIADGDIVGIIRNEFIDSMNFDIPDTELEGDMKPGTTTYKRMIAAAKASQTAGKMGYGLIFENLIGRLVVKNVYTNSPAYKAGIIPEDVIVAINSIDISGRSFNDIKDLLLSKASMFILIKQPNGDMVQRDLNKVPEATFMDSSGLQLAFPE